MHGHFEKDVYILALKSRHIKNDIFYFLLDWRTVQIMKINLMTMLFCYRKLPNAEHSCAGHETSLMFSLRAFFLQVINVSVCGGGGMGGCRVLTAILKTKYLIPLFQHVICVEKNSFMILN